jgi:hypothetical protein
MLGDPESGISNFKIRSKKKSMKYGQSERINGTEKDVNRVILVG